jgi:succinate dehydrogenase flavin-adding protein (antitoxin of CptAB toxin-antitoxin module)
MFIVGYFTPPRQDVSEDCVDVAQRPELAKLRMRIAETRIKQYRVAALLDISDGHLAHLLSGSRSADDALLAKIAAAIEEVVAAA